MVQQLTFIIIEACWPNNRFVLATYVYKITAD
jgi:hypothetical protein